MATTDGTVVILTTIFPTGAVPLVRQPVWSPRIPAAVTELNNEMKSRESEQLVLFDAHALLTNDAGVMEETFAIDTLHLNQGGSALLNENLVPLLAVLE